MVPPTNQAVLPTLPTEPNNDANTKRRLEIFENQIATMSKAMANEIASLKAQIRLLIARSDDYMPARRRFLDSHTSHIRGDAMFLGIASAGGSTTAREGDCLADAKLFDLDQRTDHGTYVELYGLTFRQVLGYRM